MMIIVPIVDRLPSPTRDGGLSIKLRVAYPEANQQAFDPLDRMNSHDIKHLSHEVK